jgi:hypothetical protein
VAAGRRGEGAALAGDLLDAVGPAPPDGLEEEHALCVLYAAVGGPTSPELRAHPDAAQSIVYAMNRPARQPFLTVLSALARERTSTSSWRASGC